MAKPVKSGKEILDDFFNEIAQIKDVDQQLAASLAALYQEGKLTDTSIKNELFKLRDQNGHQNQ